MKTHLLVYSDLNIGGIQTQLVKIAEGLFELGDEVKVLLCTRSANPQLLSRLQKVADVSYWPELIYGQNQSSYSDRKYLLSLFQRWDNAKLSEYLSRVDTVHAFSVLAGIHMTLLYSRIKMNFKPAFTIGVYHANEVNVLSKDSVFQKGLLRLISKYNYDNFILTSIRAKENLESTCHLNVCKSQLLALGVKIPPAMKSKSKCKTFQILSIGRLAAFKTYNINLLTVIRNLLNRGYKVAYTIIGNGQLMSDIKQKIEELDLQAHVNLMDEVDFSEIDSYIDNCDCFVGSGTVLLQAAGRSCPSIIGIEGRTDHKTYGFLHNTSSVSIHEDNLPYELIDYERMIIKLIECSDYEYNIIREKEFNRANEFSHKEFMLKFQKLVSTASEVKTFSTIERLSLFATLAYSIFIKLILGGSIRKHY
ncbi:glycosyltransferase [uncultured Ferrimonas sp.]|uniref:glycosyltransferase n=1 Tax=uncultured Ferrimonas sp. TaxID=432640 RepID=UPI002630B5EF|nr:glycosyltransferase [uncultured Ferrimonas sp.]